MIYHNHEIGKKFRMIKNYEKLYLQWLLMLIRLLVKEIHTQNNVIPL